MTRRYLRLLAALALLVAAFNAAQVPFQMDTITCEAKLNGFEPSPPTESTPKEYCPCDNYGEIDPMLHGFHKLLYEKCNRFCKLRDRLSTSIPIF